MQEKSLIKQNILQSVDFKGVAKCKFYQETGITRGILDQNNGMSEENTLKFLAYYPEVNVEWLLTGNGSMLKSEQPQPSKELINDNEIVALLKEKLEDKQKQITLLEENKALLQEKVAKLESEIQALKSAQSKSVNKSSQPSQSQPLIRSRR
ncbi:hypothetical protein AB4865_08540 [Capnocytophaga sp. ARDL2]|uniref:hypothetical protein n=1 Tax=Capnocytophaga sp. ARDL2 TaxID=3238809 RepID=UPI003557727F